MKGNNPNKILSILGIVMFVLGLFFLLWVFLIRPHLILNPEKINIVIFWNDGGSILMIDQFYKKNNEVIKLDEKSFPKEIKVRPIAMFSKSFDTMMHSISLYKITNNNGLTYHINHNNFENLPASFKLQRSVIDGLILKN